MQKDNNDKSWQSGNKSTRKRKNLEFQLTSPACISDKRAKCVKCLTPLIINPLKNIRYKLQITKSADEKNTVVYLLQNRNTRISAANKNISK